MLPAENPYLPPAVCAADEAEDGEAAWYLASALKYYRRMGIAMLLLYSTPVAIIVTVAFLNNEFDTATALGQLAVWSLMTGLFAALVWLGCLPHSDFPARYGKARWVGLIAGSLFLPVIGLPAFIAVRRLARYHSLTEASR